MTDPFVSVVIPAFEPGPLIDATLESVLAQTWRRREVIVVDDGSRDDTPQRVARYAGRISYLRLEREGGGAARNAGVRAARGDYVAFLDHDDLWDPRALELQVAMARRRPASGLVACDGVRFDGDRTLSEGLFHGPLAALVAAAPEGEWTGDAHGALLRGNVISTPGQVLLPRAVLDEVGPLVTDRDAPYDYDYWLRVAVRLPITLHGARLLQWRYRPQSRSGAAAFRRLRWAMMDLPVLERHLARVEPNRRAAVRAALRRRARRARLAWVVGRERGMGEARGLLRRLARSAPWSPWPRLWWLATWAPAAVVGPIASRDLDLKELETGGVRRAPWPSD